MKALFLKSYDRWILFGLIAVGVWMVASAMYSTMVYRPLSADGAYFAYFTIATKNFFATPPVLRYFHNLFQLPAIVSSRILEGDLAVQIPLLLYSFTYSFIHICSLIAQFFVLRRNGKERFFPLFLLAFVAATSHHFAISTSVAVETDATFMLLICFYFFEKQEWVRKVAVLIGAVAMAFAYETALGSYCLLFLLSFMKPFVDENRREWFYRTLFVSGITWYLYVFFVQFQPGDSVPVLDRFMMFNPYLFFCAGVTTLVGLVTICSLVKKEWGVGFSIGLSGLIVVGFVFAMSFFYGNRGGFYVSQTYPTRVWGAPLTGVFAVFIYLLMREELSRSCLRILQLLTFLALVIANVYDNSLSYTWGGYMNFIRVENLKHSRCHFVPNEDYLERYETRWHTHRDHLPYLSILLQQRRQPQVMLASLDWALPLDSQINPCEEVNKVQYPEQPLGLTLWLKECPSYFDLSLVLPSSYYQGKCSF